MPAHNPLAFMLTGLAMLLAGCAPVHDTGWSGSGAVPFDTARTRCDAEVAATATAAGRERESAFNACMARQGWKPGGG